jgi:hypothetical protein
MEKECIDCKINKNFLDFFNTYTCLNCVNNNDGEIKCKRCLEVKGKKEYYRKKSYKNGIDNVCKTCRKVENTHPTKQKNNSNDIFLTEPFDKYEEFLNLIKTSKEVPIILYKSHLFKEYKKYLSEKYKLKYTVSIDFFVESIKKYLGPYKKHWILKM